MLSSELDYNTRVRFHFFSPCGTKITQIASLVSCQSRILTTGCMRGRMAFDEKDNCNGRQIRFASPKAENLISERWGAALLAGYYERHAAAAAREFDSILLTGRRANGGTWVASIRASNTERCRPNLG